jgi:hypothetical protein
LPSNYHHCKLTPIKKNKYERHDTFESDYNTSDSERKCSKKNLKRNKGRSKNKKCHENKGQCNDSKCYCKKITWLYQSDFKNGSFLIDKCGRYVLAENISFNPNPSYILDPCTNTYTSNKTFDGKDVLDWRPDYSNHEQQVKYGDQAFIMGFFAAIIVTTNNVVIDLNGHTLEQHPHFALQQRLFSLIELGNRPFTPGTGPYDFGSPFIAPSNVKIINGVLGRSSQYGIHGNLNKNVIIKKVVFKDFEKSSISFNGAFKVKTSHVRIEGSCKQVPVMGTYWEARNLTPVLLKLSNPTNNITNSAECNTSYLKLRYALEKFFRDYFNLTIPYPIDFSSINTSLISTDIFKNTSGLPDSDVYGISINSKFNPNDFSYDNKNTVKGIKFKKVLIKDLKADVREIIALTSNTLLPTNGYSGFMNGGFGAVFDITAVTNSSTGKYFGNILSDGQLALAKSSSTMKFGNNIPQIVITWSVDNTKTINGVLTSGFKYECGGDFMHNLNKGVIGIKLDGTENVTLSNVKIDNVSNIGPMGSTICGQYTSSNPFQQFNNGYYGSYSYGITLSASNSVIMNSIIVNKVNSGSGFSYGTKIMNNGKKISLMDINIENIVAGTLQPDGKWYCRQLVGTSDTLVLCTNTLPNPLPTSYGLFVDDTISNFKVFIINVKDSSSNSPSGYVATVIDTDYNIVS